MSALCDAAFSPYGSRAVEISERNFVEAKRRNVPRAAAFYAASAWLLVQVATQVFPFFHISEWVVRWIILAATVGFPSWICLVLRVDTAGTAT